MSMKAMEAVLDNSRSGGTARLTLLAVARVADDAGGAEGLGAGELSRMTGLGERQVRRCLAAVEELGELERDHGKFRILLGGLDVGGGVGNLAASGSAPSQREGQPGCTDESRGSPSRTSDPSPPAHSPHEQGSFLPDPFDEFWSRYPRREDKQRARKAFAVALKHATIDALLTGAERYRDDPNRTPEFTKHAATWLRAGSWENGPLPPRNGNGRRDRAVEIATGEWRKGVAEHGGDAGGSSRRGSDPALPGA